MPVNLPSGLTGKRSLILAVLFSSRDELSSLVSEFYIIA